MEFKSMNGFRVNGIVPVFCCVLLMTLSPLQNSRSQYFQTKKEKDKTEAGATISIIQPPAAPSRALLDKPIDPDTYILGPGDILSIFVWGNFEGQYQLPISPEGTLLVPEIGPISVAGLTLSISRQKIAEEIRLKYRNVESTVSLVELRIFKVYVGGAVVTPGAYPATAMTRASEVISLAGGFIETTLPATSYYRQYDDYMGGGDDERIASKRNIKVARRNGEIVTADILKLALTGSPDLDPLMQDGDQIFVPVQEKKINVYGIFGAVKNPGYFEYSPLDSLKDLMNLAHGPTLDADMHEIEIVRFNPDNKTTYSIFVDIESPDWNFSLHSDDRVFVPLVQGYHAKSQVRLTGEFRYPGFYAIEEDSTTLSRIVAKAGGFTELASLEEAEMTRVSAEELVDPEFERLKKMNVADMSETEYEYFKIRSRSKVGRVSVDFHGLFIRNDATKDVWLRDNDVIDVPRKRQVVSVTGEVVNPGFLSFVPGEDYIYYIRAAGGFSDRAGKSRISIIKATTGEWRSARKGRPLEPGDTILVPEKKKRNYIATIKDVAVFVGNIATVYLVIRQATK